jgi:DNA-binding GntR family transcriptional regulator
MMESRHGVPSSKRSRSDIAYLALRQAIIEQALPPGAKLPEDEIGEQFGMSRTLARSTLQKLEAEGLVETRPKRTATVAKPTLQEAKQIFEVRRVLEREAVRLVAIRWQPEFGAALDGHIREEEAARAAGREPLSIRLAGEFHTKLCALAGNTLLEEYLSELVSRCSLILAVFGRPHSAECGIAEHRAIVAALRRRDAETAIALMESHVGSVEKRALLPAEEMQPLSLKVVLSRYADPLKAHAQAVDFETAKRSLRAGGEKRGRRRRGE